MVEQADIVAVRRAFMRGGREAAGAELQRRWPGLPPHLAPNLLDRLLALSPSELAAVRGGGPNTGRSAERRR